MGQSVPHRALLWIVGALSTLVLVITAGGQIYDNNFYTLSEAVGLFAGDHPYRGFFEWGGRAARHSSIFSRSIPGPCFATAR